MGAGEREIVKGYEDMLGVMKIPVMLIVGMVSQYIHIKTDKIYTSNVCGFLNFNYISLNLFFKKAIQLIM